MMFKMYMLPAENALQENIFKVDCTELTQDFYIFKINQCPERFNKSFRTKNMQFLGRESFSNICEVACLK
jgi:hypothetical protein